MPLDSFLDVWNAYYEYSTDAPRNFSEFSGLQILGHALKRDSYNRIQPFAVRHNMNVLFSAPSTLGRKTTTQFLAKSICPAHEILPQEFSPESFIELIKLQPHSMLFLGEFSRILKQVSKGSYLSEIVELWNELFSCPEEYRRVTKGAGETRVEKPYISINSTITPEMFNQYITEEGFKGGFLARWLLVEGIPNPRPRGLLPLEVASFKGTLKMLLETLDFFLKNYTLVFVLDQDALQRYNEAEKELYQEKEILPFVGRYIDYVIAIADILLVSDALGKLMVEVGHTTENYTRLKTHLNVLDTTGLDRNSILPSRHRPEVSNSSNESRGTNASNLSTCEVVVTRGYIERAYHIIKPCLEAVKKIADYIGREVPISKVINFLQRHEWVTIAQIMQGTHITSKQLREMVFPTLIDENRLESKEEGPVGSKKVYYRLKKAGQALAT